MPLESGNKYYIKECRMTRKTDSDPTVWQGSIQSELAAQGLKVTVFIPEAQYMITEGGTLEINAIGSAIYEGKAKLKLRSAHARKPLPINEPTGILEPDPSGHWGLNYTLTIPNLTDTGLIPSVQLIVLFQIAP